MITVNGTAFKTPQSCIIGISSVDSKDRNAAGDTLIDRTAVKRFIKMRWGALSNTDCAAILTAVSSVFFTVVYPDPQTGADRTMVCHVKNQEAPMLKYTGTTPYWEGLRMDFEER